MRACVRVRAYLRGADACVRACVSLGAITQMCVCVRWRDLYYYYIIIIMLDVDEVSVSVMAT